MDIGPKAEPEQEPWPGEKADRFLVEKGVYAQQSEQRIRLLRCIGCSWERQTQDGSFPEYTNYDLATCAGVSSHTIGSLSRVLQKAGLVEVHTLPFGRLESNETHYYSPVDTTSDGIAFQNALETPRQCGLDSEQADD